MLKELKHKIKLKLLGDPVTDTYYMYAYKIITKNNQEYKCNMGDYTCLPFEDWVSNYMMSKASLTVYNDKCINIEHVKEIQLVRIMDSFTYTRVDNYKTFAGHIVSIYDVEKIRDKNKW